MIGAAANSLGVEIRWCRLFCTRSVAFYKI